MGFSKKIKKYFKDKEMTQRKVSEIILWPELSVSKAMNSNNLSITFIEKLIKHFPDMDLNYMLKDYVEDEILPTVNEPIEEYGDENLKIISEIERKLIELKRNLARKSHDK